MDENRTLERLEYFRRLVSNIEYADLQEKLHLLKQIKRGVAEAGEDKLISKQMLQDYDDAFRNNGLLTNNIVDELETVAVRHLSQFDDAYEQMTKSLEFDKDAVQNSEKDSKEVLEQIKDAMEKYADAYSEQNGALSAVVEFGNIGNIIKDALKEDKLSKSTALRLMEPLKHMKEDMFNPRTQQSEYDAFRNILQDRLGKVDENEEEKNSQSNEGILAKAGNMFDKAAKTVANDVKNAVKKDEKAPDKAKEPQVEKDKEPVAEQGADQKFDFYMGQKRPDKQSKAQETPHKPDLERKEEAKDVSQRPEELMQREDKVQEGKQENPKGQEEALLRLKDAINKYRAVNADKKATYADISKAREAYNDAINDPLLHDFTVRFYTTDARMADIDYNQSKLLEWIDRELSNGHKQEKQGQRENTSPEIVHDNTAKGAKTEFQTKEEALENLRQLWEKLHETRAKWSEHPRLEELQESNKLFSDFHRALRNPELKDIADEYYEISRNPFENGLPNYEAVMDAINKGFGRAERPQQILRPDDMAHSADLSKKQENKDISPKPENLLHREDKTENKVDANEKQQWDYEALIDGLEDVLSHHKDRDPESFKRMMFALKDLSQQGLLPEEMKKEYMDVFNRVKELSNPRDGATQLDSKIIEHLDALEAKQQQAQNQNIPGVEPTNAPEAKNNTYGYQFNMGRKQPDNPENVQQSVFETPKVLKGAKDKNIDLNQFLYGNKQHVENNYNPENPKPHEEAHANSSMEQRHMDRSGKDTPYDFKMEKPQLSREEHIENYVQGKGMVAKMFADKEPQHKTIDQKILEAYRRKMLLGRGGGNV